MVQAIPVVADRSNQAALVGLLETSGYLFSTSEPSAVVTVGVVQGALEGVGIHGRDDDGMTLWAAGQA